MAISRAVESFWKCLEQSGLLLSRQVKELARTLGHENVTSDTEVAKRLVQLGHLTRFQASRILEGRSRGFFFDKYKVLDMYGVGGMGWVYRAENLETGEIVGLKVLLESFKNDRGMVVRFEQEARTSSRFHHENIVRTLDSGTAGGLPYVVMELVQGPSLLELLREQSRLPWEQACDIARQTALALNEVHHQGIVHRDLKPQNLLIDHAGHVKLLDFGLSMLSEGEEGDEFSMAMIFGHECVGTAAFMAPEQVLDSLKADARSDIYGLGCTFYAMLVGDTPFPFSDTKEILKAHQHKAPKNVCEVVSSIPREVGGIVARMLAKNPVDRFATASEVADALLIWSKCLPVEFDFEKILAERNKAAREKLLDIQRKQSKSPNASNSTARPSSVSSITGSSTGSMATIQKATSSIVRRDPFGFENPPAIILKRSSDFESIERALESRPVRSRMMLFPLNGSDAIPLLKDRFLIGRGEDCDLRIQDPSVSAKHCELQWNGHQWVLVDLNSRNGIRVNGDAVKKHPLRGGDTIVIGTSLRLRFSDPQFESTLTAANRFRWILSIIAAIAVVVTTGIIAYKIWVRGGY